MSNISKRRKTAQADGSCDYAAKRAELLRIAARLFKEQGFKATRLLDVAREAGLDRATVYYYVGNKEELFREIVEGVLDANILEAERLMANPNRSWLERLHRIYVGLMVSYEENYPATFVYIQEVMHEVRSEDSPWAQEFMVKTRRFEQLLLTFIREAIAAGELRSDIPPRIVEQALFGMLNWTYRWFKPGGAMTGQEVAEAFWSIFSHGMGPAAAGTKVPDLQLAKAS